MRKSDRRQAVVIGGSMSGLFAANLLRGAGWDVDIYERVSVELSGRGAGIVTHPELWAALQSVGLDTSRDFGVDISGRITLDREGRVIGALDCPQTVTSWDRVFQMLRKAFPAANYHLGKELVRIAEHADRIVAHFADGSEAAGDVLLGADGFRSTVRGILLPEVQPVYAGYIGWRGMVAEDALTPATRAEVFRVMVFCLPPGEQFLSYPVAGPDNDLRPGHRRCNFVWYRPADEATDLQRILTDDTGHVHALSIPPPLLRAQVIAELREATARLLPPMLQEVVDRTPQPFVQPIYDLVTSRMVSGRAALLGDAAFLGRPHVAAGVTKAGEDAVALVAALQTNNDVVAALEQYEAARIGPDRQIVDRGRDLGTFLQPSITTEEQRIKAARHRTPEAVMAEVAVLDFMRS
jgi:2-polyprenyl-6-methoxyphenol hydroxylase-like FAD-dependent oxidoreductase